MQHFTYDNLFLDEDSPYNNRLVDDYIATAKGRVYHGDYSWANLFMKLSMLGFTCGYQNAKLKVKQLFCSNETFEALNDLVSRMERI